MDEFEKEDRSEDQSKIDLPSGGLHEPAISPITAALIGLFGGFFLYQIVGGLLTLTVFGFKIEDAPLNAVRLMTIAGQILFILLPALIFSKAFYRDVSFIIRFKKPEMKEILLFSFGILILTPLLQSYLQIQNYFLNELAQNSETIKSVKNFFDTINDMLEKTYGNLLSINNVFEALLVVVAVSVVPAVCEEVMFRGYIQRSFEFKLKPINAALITAIFFGIYHFNPYGILPLIVLGFYFGFAAYMSNSIFVPMTLHFINNFAAVMLYFIVGDEDLIKSKVSPDIDLQTSVLLLIALGALFAAVIILIKNYYAKRR